MAGELKKAIQHKQVLGLLAEIGIPARPEGPAVACQVRLKAGDAFVQVNSSDRKQKTGSALVSSRSRRPSSKASSTRFRLPRNSPKVSSIGWFEQLSKGVKDKGKMHYSIRIDNASPLILTVSQRWARKAARKKLPKFCWGSVSHRDRA